MKTPYFYIIIHKESGKKYAGSRRAKNCHPSELLKEDGYKTSSPIIHKIIDEEGLDSFEVLETLEMNNPLDYETKFLIKNNCATSGEWFNCHNNKLVPLDNETYKKIMMEKYGVDHNSKIPSVRARMTKTQKEFYKNNPEFLKMRAAKARQTALRNGTTTKGIPRPNYTNNGNNGKFERTAETRKKMSDHQKEHSAFVLNNPMNDPEKRKLVSLSKIGRKRYIHPITKEIKMVLPENAPEGFVLAKTIQRK